jgi:hypothetical protein
MLTLKADLAPVQSKLAAIPPAVQSALAAYALAATPITGKADSLRQGLSHARRLHPDRETALKSVSGERGRGALRHGVERAPARADLHRLAVQAALAALGRGS